MDIGEVTKNTKLLIDNVPYAVESVDFVKPGKGRAVYNLRLRNLLTSAVTQSTYRSGEKVDEASVTIHTMQYLYEQGEDYVFMDSETFEQQTLTAEQLGMKRYFLREGMGVTIMMWEGRPIDIILPKAVELKVVQSTTSTKTDTITAQSKPVMTESGFTVNVPTFVKEGDVIRINTETGAYVERVS